MHFCFAKNAHSEALFNTVGASPPPHWRGETWGFDQAPPQPVIQSNRAHNSLHTLEGVVLRDLIRPPRGQLFNYNSLFYFYRFLMSLFLGPEETLEGRRLWRAGGDFEGSHEVRQRSRGHSTSCVHFYCIPALFACISIVFLGQSEVSNNFV